MPGEIDVSKLTGTVQAFGKAADSNCDGKIDTTEVSVFYDYLNKADPEFQGLWKEYLSTAGTKDTPKGIEEGAGMSTFDSEEEKAKVEAMIEQKYKNQFGDDEESIEHVRNCEYDTNKIVMNCYDAVKSTKHKNALNDLIAQRPDMNKYKTVQEYVDALENWAKSVNTKVDSLNLAEPKGVDDYYFDNIRDENGVSVKRFFDSNDNLLMDEHLDGDGNTVIYHYNGEGEVESQEIISPDGNVIETI